jgi:hypothetical protein
MKVWLVFLAGIPDQIWSQKQVQLPKQIQIQSPFMARLFACQKQLSTIFNTSLKQGAKISFPKS